VSASGWLEWVTTAGGQCTQRRIGNMVPATTPRMKIQGSIGDSRLRQRCPDDAFILVYGYIFL
jgi:hypothetical protein